VKEIDGAAAVLARIRVRGTRDSGGGCDVAQRRRRGAVGSYL
jgi:hypothetical protein